jgi:hypothetical protein
MHFKRTKCGEPSGKWRTVKVVFAQKLAILMGPIRFTREKLSYRNLVAQLICHIRMAWLVDEIEIRLNHPERNKSVKDLREAKKWTKKSQMRYKKTAWSI